MTNKKNGSTAKKGARVSKNELNAVVSAAAGVVSAPAGAGVGASGASPSIGIASAVLGGGVAGHVGAGVIGVAAPAKVRQSSADQLQAATIRENEDLKVVDLRQRIAAVWAAPEWSGAAALRASLVAIGTLSEEQITAAVSAAARKSGEDLNAITPTIDAVCEHINANFAKEFKTVCGCAVPAAGAVRLYSYTNLSLATITADSEISDYVITSGVPAGLSASGLVSVVMSVRVLVDVKKRIAAARAAARADLFAAAAGVARMALRLGVSSDVIGRYMGLKMSAVAVADESEVKRLRKNLRACWASLRACENDIVLAAPAGAFGAIEDLHGGWCFPASLPASAPAKVRKLWAKRVRLLSDICTLSALLSRC